MTRRLKLVTSLSTLAALGAFTLAGCGGEGENPEGEAGLGSIAGESEAAGGESELSAVKGDAASDDVAYIRLLGLARGHLAAFYELYRGGASEMAQSHAKHPESELYVELSKAFEARHQKGFADELKNLATAAAAGGSVDEEFTDAIAAIDAHMPKTSANDTLLAVAEIVRTAADEFDIGVEDDGTVSNAHEYQDAYGFLSASRDILSAIQTTDINETEAISLAHEQIETALSSFGALTAPNTEGRASTLYGAAARIEIAARGLG
ncbi:hypothetical protein [Hyphococcus sp.]|uniref:hypothetical protein n=1 Tax=Hyphococcus sp. TaxID=2038636 RepID=UPI00207EBCB3|nr:MAG: hypothetical protein DHS20C04_12580 [Marinicaulis sp.]